jgi:hypothetical protein
MLCFEIRELDLQALRPRQLIRAAVCKVPSSIADCGTLLSSQSYAMAKFIGSQSRCNGKHPDAIIKDLGTLLDNTQDATHFVAICSGTQKLSGLRVVTRRIYWINNCTQWSSVLILVLMFKLRVQMVNAYLGCVDAHEGRAGAGGIDSTTGCG